jgi:hypothetical protein
MTKETIESFCGSDATRPWIQVSHLVRSYVIATDGRIIIAVDTDEITEWPDEKREEWFSGMLASPAPTDLMEIISAYHAKPLILMDAPAIPQPEPERDQCTLCAGFGKVGDEECNNCEGAGDFPAQWIAKMGNLIIDARLVKKIHALPEVRWLMRPNQTPATPIPFLFGDNCKGAVMPMRKGGAR